MKQEKYWYEEEEFIEVLADGKGNEYPRPNLSKIVEEATRRGKEEGKREAFADAERIARETMDSLELKTNAEYNACDDLTKRIVRKIWEKLYSLSNSPKQE